jgi:hypothetical protein
MTTTQLGTRPNQNNGFPSFSSLNNFWWQVVVWDLTIDPSTFIFDGHLGLLLGCPLCDGSFGIPPIVKYLPWELKGNELSCKDA